MYLHVDPHKKNIERFLNEVQEHQFRAFLGPNLCPFGPNKKFHSILIQSAYYALTFGEEIRKNIERFSNKVQQADLVGPPRLGNPFIGLF